MNEAQRALSRRTRDRSGPTGSEGWRKHPITYVLGIKEIPGYRTGSRRYPVKIGQTLGNPQDRLAACQTGCPYPLIVLTTFPDSDGLEYYLHQLFSPYRTMGEWFDFGHRIDPVEHITRAVEFWRFEEARGWPCGGHLGSKVTRQ